jgi:hypothetical protein
MIIIKLLTIALYNSLAVKVHLCNLWPVFVHKGSYESKAFPIY